MSVFNREAEGRHEEKFNVKDDSVLENQLERLQDKSGSGRLSGLEELPVCDKN